MSKQHFTDVELIAKYLECKQHIAQVEDAMENGIGEELISQVSNLKIDNPETELLVGIVKRYFRGTKIYKDGMTTIENEFLRRLDSRGADNTKTDAGTAYKSTLTNFKVIDQQAFLKFCQTVDNMDMVNVTAVKDPVKQFLNGGEQPLPPGLEMSQFTRVNIRRT